MAIKPILFSTPMVQGIKKNIKKQTRRAIKFPLKSKTHHISVGEGKEAPHVSFAPVQTGDILWVRETWAEFGQAPFLYKASLSEEELKAFRSLLLKWKPSIFMPKEAARIFLKVTNVRAERLQDISEDDAIAEGILRIKKAYRGGTAYYDYSGKQTPASYNFDSPIASFKTLWQSINGRESWEANPWVWVYEFEQIEKPKDFGNE